MECKLLLSIFPIFAASRINRYIMECKLNHGSKSYRCFNELIDTLWNVNTHDEVLTTIIRQN